MSDLRVNGKTFNYPDQGKEPNNGKPQTDWASEVTTVLDNAFGLGTITETQSLIENNVSSGTPRSVAGLAFNSSLTKEAEVSYRIYRKTQLTSESSESGILRIFYSQTDPSNKWSIEREITNGEPALIYFDIDNAGQVKYWSSDKLSSISDTNYEGYIRFKTSNIIR